MNLRRRHLDSHLEAPLKKIRHNDKDKNNDDDAGKENISKNIPKTLAKNFIVRKVSLIICFIQYKKIYI